MPAVSVAAASRAPKERALSAVRTKTRASRPVRTKIRSPGLVELVLQNLRDPRRARTLAGREGIPAEELQRATERFVNAGARGMLGGLTPARWLSWGVRFRYPCKFEEWLPRAPAARASRAALLRSLAMAARRWRASGVIHRFWFMLKQPGLRLRVETDDPDAARGAVEGWLVRQSDLRGFADQMYDPEEYQFGGERGMDIAHTHFTADSLAALDFMHRDLVGKTSADLEFVHLLCITDLLQRATLDSWEMWDVWRGLDKTDRLVPMPEEVVAAYARDLRIVIHDRPAALRALGPADRRLVARYEASNIEVVRLLKTAAARGDLLFTPRQLLPFWIIFDWNRWGVTILRQRAMASGIERLLSPK